jgi:hypothetical protein
MIRITFNRKFIPLVSPFIGRGDIRYYLNGIRVEAAGDRPGVYIVGCDGHRLAVAYDKDGTIEGNDGKGVVMRAPVQLVAACKGKSKVGAHLVVAEGKRVSVSPGFGHEHSANETYVMPGDPWIEGNFPDWRRVLPCWDELKPGFATRVNAGYLADYATLPLVTRYEGIMFWQADPDGPIVVQHTSHPELVSILMPQRMDLAEKSYMQSNLAKVVAGRAKAAA